MASSAKQEYVFFGESERIIRILREMASLDADFENQSNNEFFNITMQKYIEQSNLLDPFLEQMLAILCEPLIEYMSRFAQEFMKEENINLDLEDHFSSRELSHIHSLFKNLGIITNTRGYKIVMKMLPHEVSDFESVLLFLLKQDNNDFTTWETRYMLILWLGILFLIPFPLSTSMSLHEIFNKKTEMTSSSFQSSNNMKEDDESHVTFDIVMFLLHHLTPFLNSSNSCREASSICLSCLLVRNDVISLKIPISNEGNDQKIVGEEEDDNIQELNLLEWLIEEKLNPIFDCPVNVNDSHPSDSFLLIGWLRVLGNILKKGERTQLISQNVPQLILTLITKLYSWYTEDEEGREENNPEFSQTSSYLFQEKSYQYTPSLIRKLSMKCCARCGVCLLPPVIQAWLYKRGTRSLNSSFENNNKESEEETNKEIENGQEENEKEKEWNNETLEFLTPDNILTIEKILDFLMRGLGDEDTVIRWSAAKGIGRISILLPYPFTFEILISILKLFNSNTMNLSNLEEEEDIRDSKGVGDEKEEEEEDSLELTTAATFGGYEVDKWHGSCLAIAEMGRRGAISHSSLSKIIPFVSRALVFDVLVGFHSVGANVRDAACFVIWSFSRSFSTYHLAPYLSSLSTPLVLTSLFDREVNCRRAASAAFQECVGRQGYESFPYSNTLTLLTTLDFYSLSAPSNTHFNLCPEIVLNISPQLTYPIINHLTTQERIGHWDREVRDLGGKALKLLIEKLWKHDPTNYQIQSKLNGDSNIDVEVKFEIHSFLLSKLLPSLLGYSTHPTSPLSLKLGSLTYLCYILQALGNVSHLSGGDWCEETEEEKESSSKETEIDSSSLYHPLFPNHQDLLDTIVQYPLFMDQQRLFRGKGGEDMRWICCQLISSICYLGTSSSSSNDENCVGLRGLTVKIMKQYTDLLISMLSNPSDRVPKEASKALSCLFHIHFPLKPKQSDDQENEIVPILPNFQFSTPHFPTSKFSTRPSKRLLNLIVFPIVKRLLEEENPSLTRGLALGLASLPLKLLVIPFESPMSLMDVLQSDKKVSEGEDEKVNEEENGQEESVISISSLCSRPLSLILILCHLCLINGEGGGSDGGGKDVETRINMVQSLGVLGTKVGGLMSKSEFDMMIHILICCLDDYSSEEKRGDVGGWVRRESMIQLSSVCSLFSLFPHDDALPSFCEGFSPMIGCPPIYSSSSSFLNSKLLVNSNIKVPVFTPFGRGHISQKSDIQTNGDSGLVEFFPLFVQDNHVEWLTGQMEHMRNKEKVEIKHQEEEERTSASRSQSMIIPISFVQILSTVSNPETEEDDDLILPSINERRGNQIIMEKNSSFSFIDNNDENQSSYLTVDVVTKILGSVMRLWGENRDDLRKYAGYCLYSILISPPPSIHPSFFAAIFDDPSSYTSEIISSKGRMREESLLGKLLFVSMREGVETAMKRAISSIFYAKQSSFQQDQILGESYDEFKKAIESKSDGLSSSPSTIPSMMMLFQDLSEIQVCLPSLLLIGLFQPYALSIISGISSLVGSSSPFTTSSATPILMNHLSQLPPNQVAFFIGRVLGIFSVVSGCGEKWDEFIESNEEKSEQEGRAIIIGCEKEVAEELLDHSTNPRFSNLFAKKRMLLPFLRFFHLLMTSSGAKNSKTRLSQQPNEESNHFLEKILVPSPPKKKKRKNDQDIGFPHHPDDLKEDDEDVVGHPFPDILIWILRCLIKKEKREVGGMKLAVQILFSLFSLLLKIQISSSDLEDEEEKGERSSNNRPTLYFSSIYQLFVIFTALLLHPVPHIRKLVANELYLTIMGFGDEAKVEVERCIQKELNAILHTKFVKKQQQQKQQSTSQMLDVDDIDVSSDDSELEEEEEKGQDLESGLVIIDFDLISDLLIGIVWDGERDDLMKQGMMDIRNLFHLSN